MKQRNRRNKRGQKRTPRQTQRYREEKTNASSSPTAPLTLDIDRQLELALSEFANADPGILHGIPNYFGFSEWFDSWVASDQTDRRIYPRFLAPSFQSKSFVKKLQVFAQALKQEKQILQEAEDDSPPYKNHQLAPEVLLKHLNRFKLLYHIYINAGHRFRENIDFLSSQPESSISLDAGLGSCTQAELRSRFFQAVDAGLDRAALRILGKLREDVHDPGELDYLDAVCDFFAGDFPRAIERANAVAVDHQDYPSAQGLIMESLARSGAEEKLIAKIAEHLGLCPSFETISQFYVRYLLQVLVENSVEPDKVVDRILQVSMDFPPFIPDWRDPNEALWTRHSCKVATELAERLEEFRHRFLAIEQSEGDPRTIEEIEAECSEPFSKRNEQLIGALVFDPRFPADFVELDSAQRCKKVVEILLNPPRECQYVDLKLGLNVQWRLGQRDLFLDNVLRSLDGLPYENDPQVWDLVVWAYQHALSIGDSRCPELQEKLEAREIYQHFSEQVERDAKSETVLRSLTPMGRISFETAVMSHQHALQLGEGWKDAGPISLTFFRTLEVELNQRLFKSALFRLGAETIRGAWAELREKIVHEGGGEFELSKRAAQVVKFWDRNAKALADLAESKSPGLELGAIEIILGKVSKDGGIDEGFKAMLRSGLQSELTAEGLAALRDGRMAKTISEEKRNRYRNPPAHSRYLPLSIATECRQFVEGALEDYGRWIVPKEF